MCAQAADRLEEEHREVVDRVGLFGEVGGRLFVAVGHQLSVVQSIVPICAEGQHQHIGATQTFACLHQGDRGVCAAGCGVAGRDVGGKPPVVPQPFAPFEKSGVGQGLRVEQHTEVVGDDARCVEWPEGIDERMPRRQRIGDVLPDVLREARAEGQHMPVGIELKGRGGERHGSGKLHCGRDVRTPAGCRGVISCPCSSVRPNCTISL